MVRGAVMVIPRQSGGGARPLSWDGDGALLRRDLAALAVGHGMEARVERAARRPVHLTQSRPSAWRSFTRLNTRPSTTLSKASPRLMGSNPSGPLWFPMVVWMACL